MQVHAGWHLPWNSLGNAYRKYGVCNKRQTSREGNLLYSLALAISSGISTCTLYSSSGVTEPQFRRCMLAETTGILTFSATSCAALPTSLSLHIKEMWLPVPASNWSDPPYLLLRLKSVTTNKAMGKKLHHIHKTRHIPIQTRRWHRDSISLLLLGFWSPALLLNFSWHQLSWMLLKGRSHHSHKAAEHTQPKCIGTPKSKLWTFFRECALQPGGLDGTCLFPLRLTKPQKKSVWRKRSLLRKRMTSLFPCLRLQSCSNGYS